MNAARSFVEFLLEPLYKIFAQTVGDVDTTLPQMGVVKELSYGGLQLYTYFFCSKPNFVDTSSVGEIFQHVHAPPQCHTNPHKLFNALTDNNSVETHKAYLLAVKATQRKLLVSQALPLPFLGTAFSLFIAN